MLSDQSSTILDDQDEQVQLSSKNYEASLYSVISDHCSGFFISMTLVQVLFTCLDQSSHFSMVPSKLSDSGSRDLPSFHLEF